MKSLRLLELAIIVALFSLSVTIFLGNIAKQELTNMAGKQMALSASTLTNPYSSVGPGVVSSSVPVSQTAGGRPVQGPYYGVTERSPYNSINVGSSGVLGAMSGAGSTSASPQIDQAVLGQYDQSIGNTQAALNRLGDQFNSGVSGIDSSFTNALNQLLLGKNQANSAYSTNKQQTAKDYVGAKNTIGANAGSSLSGLLRLLGSRGAGGSSAATITAPGAVARNATLQRQDVGSTFGANNQALDTGWNNYLTGYNNQVSGATSQRDQQKSELQRQIDTNRASLLQTLASLSGQRAQAAGGNPTGAAQPYLDQANAVLDQTSRYNIAPINYQTQAYNAPELSKYTTNPNAAPTYNGQRASSDYFSPYLSALLGKKQQYA